MYKLSTIPFIIAVLDCGEPPPLENGDFSLGTITVNSTAVYFCKEAYGESQGPGVSNEIHCMTNGKWSELNLKCIADGEKRTNL